MENNGQCSEKTNQVALVMFSRCLEHGKFPGRVEFAKYLYLLDWAYYRYRGERATEIDWHFYHYGPWSFDLIPACQAVQGHFRLGWEDFTSDDHEFVGFDPILEKLGLTAEAIIQRILNSFSKRDVSLVIDFCYRLTEPMAHARRGDRLEFATIPVTREVPVFVAKPVTYSMPQLAQSQSDARELLKRRIAHNRSAVEEWKRALESPAYQRGMAVLGREVEHDLTVESDKPIRVQVSEGMLEQLDHLKNG